MARLELGTVSYIHWASLGSKLRLQFKLSVLYTLYDKPLRLRDQVLARFLDSLYHCGRYSTVREAHTEFSPCGLPARL